MKFTPFDKRMKEYENAYRMKLPKRMPVIIRIDGKAFHTYTKGMTKPFDGYLTHAMWETCKYLAKNIMGCKLAYTQSDEISLLLTNYEKVTTESWFNNNIQKIVSVSASLATAKFNEVMREEFPTTGVSLGVSNKLALFDSRVWVLPKEEVINYFIWRQQDATKNSIQMVAQAEFSHGQLQGLNSGQLQDKLFLERGINWNGLPTWQKRGSCIKKVNFERNGATRSSWDVDLETPIFSQDRNYIERYVY